MVVYRYKCKDCWYSSRLFFSKIESDDRPPGLWRYICNVLLLCFCTEEGHHKDYKCPLCGHFSLEQKAVMYVDVSIDNKNKMSRSRS